MKMGKYSVTDDGTLHRNLGSSHFDVHMSLAAPMLRVAEMQKGGK